jgi:HD-GYP domain-containing protein (c-di-GMP phosphodiesterase class II)
MRICSIKDLKPGMMLGKSLFSEKGQLLLRAGFLFDAEILRLLRETGRSAVYILEEGTEDIIPEDIISEETRCSATQAFHETISKVAEAAAFRQDIPPEKLATVIKRGAEYRNVVDIDRISGEITSIVDEIMDSSVSVLNQTLMKSRTGYNTEHAVDTALTAVLIGRKLNYNRRELVELGAGSFLHDVGKLALPDLLKKDPAEYSEQEQAIMREHPVFGQQLLENSTDRFFMAQAAILQHHERQDGMGYPAGRKGRNKLPQLGQPDASNYIFPFSEIISVADAYDNLISRRNSCTMVPEQAIRDLAVQAGTAFNQHVVAVLAEVISIFPTGSIVKIAECSNAHLEGLSGAVMKANIERAHHPILVLLYDKNGAKTTPKITDLSEEPYSRLELIL